MSNKNDNPYHDPNFKFTDSQIENLINILIQYNDPNVYVSCGAGKLRGAKKKIDNQSEER